MTQPASVRAALLDIDGTLVDSNEAHARAWVDALEEAGECVPIAAVRPLIGMGGDKLVEALAGLSKDDARSKKIRERRQTIFAERYVARVRPFAGVRELLSRMGAAGLRRVVATSSARADLERLLEVARITDLIDDSTDAEDVEATKPQPDIVLAALGKAGCTPEEAVLLGDTPWDVAAAARAGVRTVALRTGGWRDEDLAGAVAIFDDPAHVLRCWDETPFAARNTPRLQERRSSRLTQPAPSDPSGQARTSQVVRPGEGVPPATSPAEMPIPEALDAHERRRAGGRT